MTESEIIAGLKDNHEWVFDHVFDEYFPRMQFFAGRIIDDQETARDIVNKVFLSLWKLRSKFDTIANVQAFLYITTRNNCLDFLRQRKREQKAKRVYESNLSDIPDEKTVDIKITEAQLMVLIHQKIEALPNRCREIFKLTYFEGLKAGEIAERLGISTSTVTTQRSIAIKHLKAVLSEEDFLVFLLLINGGLQMIPHTVLQ